MRAAEVGLMTYNWVEGFSKSLRGYTWDKSVSWKAYTAEQRRIRPRWCHEFIHVFPALPGSKVGVQRAVAVRDSEGDASWKVEQLQGEVHM